MSTLTEQKLSAAENFGRELAATDLQPPADQTPAPPQEKPYYARYYKIGQHCSEQGGVYAGIASGDEGKSAYHLFVGPDLGAPQKWEYMLSLTNEYAVGNKTDYSLPTIRELSLIFANAPQLLTSHLIYWSSIFDDANIDRDFVLGLFATNGRQKGFDFRRKLSAVIVCRLTVQPSNNLILDRSALEFKNKATPGGVSFFKTETTLGVSDKPSPASGILIRSDILIRASEPTLVTGSGFKTADLNLKMEAHEPNASEKISKLAAAIVAFAAFVAVSGCSIFEPRIEVTPVAQALRDMPPAMQTAMQDLSSPTITAALRRAQGNLDEVQK